jgi:gamma-glutamyltranspeptidase / glutathione hydrolase
MELSLSKITESKRGMVVAAHPLAAEAGRKALLNGANAIEAAVAVSLVLNVVEPFASGLGGGGYMMVSPRGSFEKTEVLDGRARLSSLAKEEYIYPRGVMLPWTPKTGVMSAAVPGLGRLLKLALERYGKGKELEELVSPAIELAQNGFEVSDVLIYCSSLFEGTVRATKECAKIYYNNGVRYKPGEILKQKDLARALTIVAKEGFEACYTGQIGKAMMETINATGPVWGVDDLKEYEVKIRRPLRTEIAGHTIATNGPPSRGGAGIIQTLLRYERDPVRLAPVIRSIFKELSPIVGDPDVMEVDLNKLVEGPDGPPVGGGTTHFVIVDEEQNIVSMSQTIGHFFGSGVIVNDYGILLNDDISDMERKPGHPNSIGHNKRSVNNMAPTTVFKDGRPRLSLGTPGSVRIFPAMAQVIGNVLFKEMNLADAVAAGRIHWEDNRFFFEGDIDEEERKRAKIELDHPVDERRKQDLFFGGVHGIEIREDGTIVGVADPRRDGVAIGL